MSTRSCRSGNKYIKVEDIDNIIFESDEEDSVEETGEKSVDIPVTYNQERERLKLDKWYGCSSYSPENKLNNSNSNVTVHQRNKRFSNNSPVNNSKDESFSSELGEIENCRSNTDIQKTHRYTEESSFSTRKRASPIDLSGTVSPKKLKVEVEKEMCEAPAVKPLKIELYLEYSRKNEPIKRRNINTIMEELDQIERRWKEGNSRYIPTFQWGQPVIKNCPKWASHSFPKKMYDTDQKIYEADEKMYGDDQKRYQERYSQRIGDSGYDRCDSQSDIVEARGVRIDSGKVDEEGSEALEYEPCKYSGGPNSIEDDLNSFNTDMHGRMTLRIGNQRRGHQDDSTSNEAGMSEQKDKMSKKGSAKNKEQKKFNSNRQLVGQVGSDPHRQYQNEDSSDSNKNFEDIKENYEEYGSSSQNNASKSHYEEIIDQGPMRMNEDDQVVCPICEKKFEKSSIEFHANNCATEKFHD